MSFALSMVAVASCSSDEPSSPETDGGTPADAATSDTNLSDAPRADADAPDAPDASDAGDARPRAVGLSSGACHTCVVMTDGTVRCWGCNRAGQLALTLPDGGPVVATSHPTRVPGITNAAAVAASDVNGFEGYATTCARLQDGTVSCWGANGVSNVLGRVDAGEAPSPVPAPVTNPNVQDATDLSVGSYHACTVNEAGAVTCWGQALFTADASTPSVVPGLAPASRVSASYQATCVLLQTGGVSCFGSDNGIVSSFTPKTISGLDGVTSVASRARHACALMGSAGTVSCWGYNYYGQLGHPVDGGEVDTTPTIVPLNGKAIAIGMGSYHTCAVLDDQSLWCWGYNGQGQLGPAAAGIQPTPSRVTGIPEGRIVQIAGGQFHTCALFEEGSVYCWGANREGQLGRSDGIPDGGAPDMPDPAPVVFSDP